MNIEARQGVVAKKLWKMVTKGIAKTKSMIHLNLILKRGKHAGKDFINTLLMNRQLYYSSFTCRSDNDSFISPFEYEFSCSNTPVNPLHHSSCGFSKPRQRYKDLFVMNNNNNNGKVEAVKNSLNTLPGFGKNHVGRQLRVTHSPLLLIEEGDNYQVDMAAEEFINNFYKQLNRQNRSIATYESPYN